jgi:hypothetical protein
LNHSLKYSFHFPWTLFVARGALHVLLWIIFARWLRFVHFIWASTLYRNPSLFYHFQVSHISSLKLRRLTTETLPTLT